MKDWKKVDGGHSVYNVLPLLSLQRKCLCPLDPFYEILPWERYL